MRHRRWVRSLVPIAAILLALQAAPALAVEDTSPPVGSLTIEGGAAYTSDRVVVLDVPATDDVGVAIVRARLGGLAWTEFAYAPQVTFDFDASGVVQQLLTIQVEWQDAAGNTSSAQGTIWYDVAAPNLQSFAQTTSAGPPGTLTLGFSVLELGSGVPAARFSTNGGSTWGVEVPVVSGHAAWNPRDPAQGGKAGAIGSLTVHGQVRDGAGRWSNVRSAVVEATSNLALGVSDSPTTGQPVTLSAQWDAAVTLPAGASCLWEFMWGDDKSITNVRRNETFGYIFVQGTAGHGYCTQWTFTLPWTPVRRYLVALHVRAADGTQLGDVTIGGDVGQNAFTSQVGSTSRSITTSNLPMIYILPDAYQLTVGQPAIYHGYTVGGATIKSSDKWMIEYENVPEFHSGSATLTFYPKHTGNLTVCLYREGAGQMGGCFDPPVKAGSGGGSGGTGGSGGGTGSPTGVPGTADPSGDPSSEPSEVAASDAHSGDPEVGTQPPDVALASAGPTSTPMPEGAAVDGESGTGSSTIGIALAVAVLGASALWAARSDEVRRRLRGPLAGRRR